MTASAHALRRVIQTIPKGLETLVHELALVVQLSLAVLSRHAEPDGSVLHHLHPPKVVLLVGPAILLKIHVIESPAEHRGNPTGRLGLSASCPVVPIGTQEVHVGMSLESLNPHVGASDASVLLLPLPEPLTDPQNAGAIWKRAHTFCTVPPVAGIIRDRASLATASRRSTLAVSIVSAWPQTALT